MISRWDAAHTRSRDDVHFVSLDPKADVSVGVIVQKEWGAGFHSRRSNPRYHVLNFAVGGRGTFVGETGESHIGPGWVFSYGPGCEHEIGCDPDDPLSLYAIGFLGRRATTLVRDHLGALCTAVRLSRPCDVGDVMARMLRRAHEGGPFIHEMMNQYLLIVLLTIHAQRSVGPQHVSARDATYYRVRSYIDAHFAERITVASVAEACGVSYEHASRVFSSHAGISPSAYLQKLRMEKAQHLLISSDYKVAEVARRVGYEDLYTFSKAFKRVVGVSPLNYRTGAHT